MADRHPTLVFRLNDHGQGPDLVRQVFLEKGWTEFDEETQPEHDWNLWWRTSRFRNCDYEDLMPWQRLNHYPRSTAITKKDSLARNLKRMRGVYGPTVYNFSPIAFNLPNDYTKFVAEYSKLKEIDKDKTLYWICKPADMSRGRGIFIFKELSELQYDCNAVVQKYISNPILISGYKYDLRLYVAVPSFHPLNIYVYNEGLVRFSTEKFDLNCLDNMFSHLTNTSINKHSPSYSTDKERVGPGCKWVLSQLRHFFHQANMNDQALWSKIMNIIILTLLIQANQVPKASNCFELYGFDVMIDENFKPWLLEVNFSPALSCDCQADSIVKKPMVHDMIDMMGFQEKDKNRGGNDYALMKKMQSWNDFPGRGLPRTTNSGVGSSIGRLPNITWSNAQSLMLGGGSRYSSHSYNDAEEEESATDQDVVPIVPGCGLPSVQNPMSSGRSSASSGRSSEHGRKHSHGRRTDHRQHVHVNKKLPKGSIQSDSGVSSFSGSSDNSDPGSYAEELYQYHGPAGSYSRSADSAKMASKGMATITRANLKYSLESHSEAGSHDNIMRSSPLVRHTIPGMTRVCKTDQKRKLTHIAFTANPLSGKSSMLGRRGSMSSMAQSRSRSYAKPWRRTKGTNDSPMSTANHSPKNPITRIGDFSLIFPFSETTRKCAMQSLDPRIVIRECQKLLKHNLEVASASGSETSRSTESGKDNNGRKEPSVPAIIDIPLPWGPVGPGQVIGQ